MHYKAFRAIFIQFYWLIIAKNIYHSDSFPFGRKVCIYKIINRLLWYIGMNLVEVYTEYGLDLLRGLGYIGVPYLHKCNRDLQIRILFMIHNYTQISSFLLGNSTFIYSQDSFGSKIYHLNYLKIYRVHQIQFC